MPKKPYMKPVFVKQNVGVMNKFGNSYLKSFRETIDGITISDLVAGFGSPLFVMSERTLRQQYHYVNSAFSTRYPNVKFAWSYKTNYLNAICSLFHQEGLMAEVVSQFEYEKARALGVPGENIIFNGPYKGEILEQAFKENAIINIDNFNEIIVIEEIARKMKKRLKVGIRVNMDTGVYPQWFKFGFNIENKQAYEAVNRIMRSEHLRLNGIHSHIGTFILDPNAYKTEVEKMVLFMQEIEKEFNIAIEYIDIGGGFPSKSRLKGIYLPPEVTVPPIEEYAEAVCSTLLRMLKPNAYPRLYVESGRALVDESGYLITTVVANKYLPDGVKSYYVDSGINMLYTAGWYNFSILPDKQIQGIPENCRIFGSLCMNIDIISELEYLPPLNPGNRLVIHPVGAYNITQWMQFIFYRPAVVMVMESGSVECIRRKEHLEDVTGCENIPEKLLTKIVNKPLKK
jgi:diaminopimelate decarboxylase